MIWYYIMIGSHKLVHNDQIHQIFLRNIFVDFQPQIMWLFKSTVWNLVVVLLAWLVYFENQLVQIVKFQVISGREYSHIKGHWTIFYNFLFGKFHLSGKNWLQIYKYKKKNSKIPSKS